MRLFRRSIFFFLVVLSLVYFTIGILFYIYYRQPSIPLLNYTTAIMKRVEPILVRYGVQNLYVPSFDIKTEHKSTFLLEFSKADLEYKDSIIQIAKEGKISLLEDRFKKWRNFKIIYGNNDVKAKFKLHGSSLTPYLNDHESFTIKSKLPINGRKNFKLITGREMDFNIIFNNHIAKSFNLFAEDTGDIIVTNSLGHYRDFFQYEIFDEEYLFNEYDLKEAIIIRRLTFDNGKRNWHSSMLDDTYYNIDLDFIQREKLGVWNEFLLDPTSQNYDFHYMGRFFALLQLYNSPHQILGNNDKWVLSNNNLLYPVFREEGELVPLSDISEIERNLFFQNYYYSESFDVYKKILLNDEVLNHRNRVFKEIVDSKKAIIHSYDSIYSKYSSIHKLFGSNFLRTKLVKNKIHSTIEKNIQLISDYLNSGYTVISHSNDELILRSSRKNTLKVSVDGVIVYFSPIHLRLKDSGEVVEELNELLIEGIENLNDLIIEDVVLEQKLLYEKDYSIIRTF